MKRRKGFRKDGKVDRRWGRQPLHAKVERNDELIKDKMAGMSMLDLMIKYGISTTRIYQIIGQYKSKTGEGAVHNGN